MKKFIAIVLAAVFCLAALTACGDGKKSDNSKNDLNDTAGVSADDSGTGTDKASSETDTNKESDWEYIKNKGKMIVGVTMYEPMNYKDANGNWTGFDTEFAQKVAEKLDIDVEFIAIEWNGKIEELNSRAIDCVWNGMTLTDDVLAAMSCTDPYIINAQVVVMAKDKAADYTTVESLKDLTFSAESGSAGEEALKSAGLNCTSLDTQSDALLEVKSGSVDACVIDITMAKAMVGEGTNYSDLAVGMELTSEEYGIGFRKGSDMVEKVNEIIKELTESGFMDQIGEKYDLKANLASNLAD